MSDLVDPPAFDLPRFDLPRLRAETLALLTDWTPIAGVPGDHAALARMAGKVADYLRDRLGAEIVEDGRRTVPPIVHGRIDRGAPVTLLLYNMYDVMPATPGGWSVDPFVGGILELDRLGPCFVGRGAENNKGPLAGMLVALSALLAADRLPANIEILVEGEEEVGSAALQRYLQSPDTPVRRSVAALFPSFCEYGGGAPRVYCGFKGIVHGFIRSSGGAWGGPSAAIHGSNAPWIANPAWRLVQALAILGKDAAGSLFRTELPEMFRPMLVSLAADFDERGELDFRRTQTYAVPGDAAARLDHVLTTASLNLSRLATDPLDARGIIPSAAEARFDLRLPPGAVPEDVIQDLRDRLVAAGLDDVAIEVAEGFPGTVFSPTATGVRPLIETYRQFGAEPQVWPWAIGAAPAHAFADIADSFLIGGLGHGGNAHGIDEFVTLQGIDRFLGSLLSWLPALAAEAILQPPAHP